MAALNLPEVPAPLKNIQQYLKTATEHEQRDPVVCYWARLFALQTGLKLSTKTSEETGFLLKLMDWLEASKKAYHDNEAISNEVAAQAHLENYALKLFLYADRNDREANFGKNVVKAFYTAGIIYDLLSTFGELSEEAAQNRKYAKWKAAYIHNCLKNGETPVPGPMSEEGDDDSNLDPGPARNVPPTSGLAGFIQPTPPPSTDAFGFPSVPNASNINFPTPPVKPTQGNSPYPNIPNFNNTPASPSPNPQNPAPPPRSLPASQPATFNPEDYNKMPITEGGVVLDTEHMAKAHKYLKWVKSALDYDDIPTAVLNTQKVLHLLTTGQDPA